MKEIQDIIEQLYQAFACYNRPEHFTNYKHCDECFEHDETMRSANLQTLSGYQIGTSGWSPLSFLTIEGFAYYIPRMIELALTGEKNKHGESVLSILLYQLAPTDHHNRFSNYSTEQRHSILIALQYALAKHHSEIVEEFIQEDLENAIRYWQKSI